MFNDGIFQFSLGVDPSSILIVEDNYYSFYVGCEIGRMAEKVYTHLIREIYI